MDFDIIFLINSILLGVGLAMDAFSVSMANGLKFPNMKMRKMAFIAGIFAGFQAFMPMIGWVCVHYLLTIFQMLQSAIPWIAFCLLAFIGGKMILDGVRGEQEEIDSGLGLGALLIQGIATSIDALSVGFTIVDYHFWKALCCAAIIAAVTFVICVAGIEIGKRFGTRLAGRATILGGIILVLIGIEIACL